MSNKRRMPEDLEKRFYAADTIEELQLLMDDVEARVQTDSQFRPRTLRTAIWRAMRDVATEFDVAREFILKHIWPVCVEGKKSDNEPSSSIEIEQDGTKVVTPSRAQEAQYEAHEAREFLGEWLASWVKIGHPELRVEITHLTCAKALEFNANVTSVQAACWTLDEIGWRSDEVERTLWQLLERDDLAGDVASGVLVDLGISLEQRPSFIAQIVERARKRPVRYNAYALTRLAEPELVDEAIAMFHAFSPFFWYDGTPRTQDEDRSSFEQHLKLSFLSTLADELADNLPAQEQIWAVIYAACCSSSEEMHELLFTGNLAPHYNSSRMISDFLSVIPQILEREAKEDKSKPQNGESEVDPTHWTVYLAAERLSESVRPQQLEGWKNVSDSALRPFCQIAFCNTYQRGLNETSPMRAKESAWRLLALAGQRWNSDDVQKAIADETSGSTQNDVADLVACFGCDPLPPIVRELLTAQGDEANGFRDLNNGEDLSLFSACRGAENLARGTATRNAFESLLGFTYVFGEDVLRSTTDALDEVAVHLVKQGDFDIIDDLWQAVSPDRPLYRRQLAISGLHALAGHELLPVSDQLRLLHLAKDESLDRFFRSLAVQSIGFRNAGEIDFTIGEELLALWLRERGTVPLELVSRTRETLARHELWKGENELLFLSDLGLEQRDGEWRLQAMEWSSVPALFFVYQANKERFRTAICDVFSQSNDEVAYALTFWLLRQDKMGLISLEPEIAQNIKQQIYRTSSRGAKRYLLDALALGSPKILIEEAWNAEAGFWSTAARGALAHALGEADATECQTENAFNTLKLLALDETFVVRRAALRALATLLPERLSQQCREWSESVSTFEREVAAQGVFWLNESSDINELHHRLLNDVEHSVRKAAKDSQSAARERRWADDYLRRVEEAARLGILGDAFAFGTALEKLGDDSHLRRLQRINLVNARPSVRFWLRQLAKTLEKNWQEKTSKWDDLGKGAVSEKTEGVLKQKGRDIEVEIWLWLRPAAGIRGTSAWGGRLCPKNRDDISLSLKSGQITLVDGRIGEVLIGHSVTTFGIQNEAWASFSGQGRLN